MTDYLRMLHERDELLQNRMAELRKEGAAIEKEKEHLLVSIGRVNKEIETRTSSPGIMSLSPETEMEGVQAENKRLQDENRRVKLALQYLTGNFKFEEPKEP